MAVQPLFIGLLAQKAISTLGGELRDSLRTTNFRRSCQPGLCEFFVNYSSRQIVLKEHTEYLDISPVMSAIDDEGVYHEVVFPVRSVCQVSA